MNKNIIRNVDFNNLVNYQTLYSNSSVTVGAYITSSDPNSLASVIQNNQMIKFNLIIPVEKIIAEKTSIEVE